MKRNNYIAIAFLTAFVLSYLGQSLHVIAHIYHDHADAGSCCHHTGQCQDSKMPAEHHDFALDTPDGFCPVCNFHFIDFSAAHFIFAVRTFPEIHLKTNYTYTSTCHLPDFASYYLRGPPMI